MGQFGLPAVLLAIILAVVLGAVLGSRHNSASGNKDDSSAARSIAAGGAGTSAGKDTNHVLFSGYNAYGVPQYPSSASQLFNTLPTFSSSANLAWGNDPNAPDKSGSTVRQDHPRLFAPTYKWDRLPALIQVDPYLSSWNTTIFSNATVFYNMEPTNYSIDGGYSGSGVLDVAREVQLRLKYWAYAYRLTKDTKWVDRAWRELQTAAGNTTQPFGRAGNNWNTDHWLDVAEFTIAFAIAYDWMYEAWTAEQRNAIMWSIINLGLQKGIESHATNAWFLTTNGNWNCITNGGMVVGSLAIMNEDPTGTASKLLPLALQSASTNCVNAVSTDGTWSETSDYWYFGSQGHAHMTSALQTATGSTHQLLTANPSFNLTGLYHMYVYGNTYKANTGDCGPNKYVATANPLLYYGDQYQIPRYILYQRDRADAADPLNPSDAWVSMRSSWTNTDGVFASVKSGGLTGHQTHDFLDAGTLTLDALGERWIGHLCQNDYLGAGYFSSEGVNSHDVKRGLRFINGRTQILVQDEIVGATVTSQWRVHTNSTITVSGDGTSANMKLNGKTMIAKILSPSGTKFTVSDPVRLPTSPPVPSGSPDLPNPGVKVLTINIPAGSNTVSVLFSPQWGNGLKSKDDVKVLALDSWSLTSHN
ncbi:hypothetical protein H4Q26_009624 [Puccinia striiformis f. sp. tritici PST-130]|nr:hypothetical protein H4Q26_009624 [Puccinia striiformis f. sp. tritici PST-130]